MRETHTVKENHPWKKNVILQKSKRTILENNIPLLQRWQRPLKCGRWVMPRWLPWLPSGPPGSWELSRCWAGLSWRGVQRMVYGRGAKLVERSEWKQESIQKLTYLNILHVHMKIIITLIDIKGDIVPGSSGPPVWVLSVRWQIPGSDGPTTSSPKKTETQCSPGSRCKVWRSSGRNSGQTSCWAPACGLGSGPWRGAGGAYSLEREKKHGVRELQEG